MADIKLKRGGREVSFSKSPTQFGVRLKQGRAPNQAALAVAAGRAMERVEHVGAVRAENLDLFELPKGSDLEGTMQVLRDAPASSVVTHAYHLGGAQDAVVVPTGTMTIQFRPDVSDDAREQLLAAYGLEIVADLDFLPSGYTVRLTASSKENPLKIAQRLQANKDIVTAEPDLSFQRALKGPPTDTMYAMQWHLKNRGDALGLKAGADVKAEEAWEITQGTRDITVCVIDDGFDLTHADFAVPGKIVAPRDFGQNDSDPSPGSSTDNHGTACAGVAIAEANGTGVVGLAPKCAFMPVRMAEWLSDETIVAMFQHAMDQGADVVSCSWSAAAPYFPLSTKMTAIITKVATQGRRNGKGCVILFAAGNENRPLDQGSTIHQGFALHPHVIAVAASNSLDMRSDYSNFGPQIAICAPSSGSPGRRIVTTDRSGAAGYATSDFTDTFGGTSSATPLSAGLAALILSVNPNLTSAEVKRIMMDSADKIDQAGGDYTNGHSSLYGHGRIHAAAAVRLAGGVATTLPKMLVLEHRVNLAIPDLKTVEDKVPFPLDKVARAVEVSVEIAHTYSGDLKIELLAPNGQTLVLYDREGGSTPNVSKAFRSSDLPNVFEGVIGKAAKGDWLLRVKDTAAQDQGVLVRWSLGIAYDG